MNLDKIAKVAASGESMNRPLVQGRVLHYDADFACYEVSDLEEPTSKSYKRLLEHIDMKRAMVGAERVIAYITLGEKSGREAMATVKGYQEERDPDKPIKVRVRELRHLLANLKGHSTIEPCVGLRYEADDLMCMAMQGNPEHVIMSGDKDLWMVQGLHADAKSGRIWTVDGYGKTEYREVGNVKPKLIGEGYSWFWHQMIMGDKVDDIPGLPKLTNNMLDKYLPLKSGKPRKAGTGACGEAKAVAVLDGVTSSREAAQRTYELYWELYGGAASEMFIEQAYLLWMQRNDNPWDVLTYLTEECGMKVVPTERQRKVVEEFKERCAVSSQSTNQV